MNVFVLNAGSSNLKFQITAIDLERTTQYKDYLRRPCVPVGIEVNRSGWLLGHKIYKISFFTLAKRRANAEVKFASPRNLGPIAAENRAKPWSETQNQAKRINEIAQQPRTRAI